LSDRRRLLELARVPGIYHMPRLVLRVQACVAARPEESIIVGAADGINGGSMAISLSDVAATCRRRMCNPKADVARLGMVQISTLSGRPVAGTD
jgi:hypothetical protein